MIDGVQQDSLNLTSGKTYTFDWSDASNHPLRFSTAADGTHSGGSDYAEGVHVDTVNFTTTITVAENAPDLYCYCEHHPGMGGTVTTQTLSLKDMLIEDAVSAGLDPYHVDEAATTSIPLIEAQPGAGDYAYVDRSAVQLFMSQTVQHKI